MSDEGDYFRDGFYADLGRLFECFARDGQDIGDELDEIVQRAAIEVAESRMADPRRQLTHERGERAAF